VKRGTPFLKSSLSFILIVALVLFLIEIAGSLLTPKLEGVNKLNNILIDAFIPTIIVAPLLWRLVKYRDRFEEELKESEERFRTLFEGAPDAIFLADPETGIIIDANSKASELTARPNVEIIGMHQEQLHPPRMEEYSRRTFKEHEKIIKQKEIITPFENFVLRPDGTEVPVEVLAQIVTIKGKPVLQGVFRDITERKNAEKRLEASFKQVEEEKAKTESIIAAIGDAISIQDTDFEVLYQNKIHQDILGEQKGKYCYMVYEHKDQICERCPVKMSFKDGKIHTEERRIIKNGKELYFEITASPLRDSTGNIIAGIEVARDITDRKEAEKQIKNSLKEKEMLLREIHHRVKNNMQVISSLLYLQSGYIKDKKYLEMFRDSQNRITSMSLIHEKLCRSKDLAKIEFNEYIRDLANRLFQSHGVKTGTIVLNINLDNISLGIDQAIPCGLIINELINNSLKHAFPEDRKGDINISLHHNDDNMVELVVSDNGVGFPSDLDFRKTESLGLRLVTVLAEDQLHGKIELDRRRGTKFNIKFKEGNDGKKTNISC
jgi:PAS domain S-box-containing protein